MPPSLANETTLEAQKTRIRQYVNLVVQFAESQAIQLSSTCQENMHTQAESIGLNAHGAVIEVGIFKDITQGDIEGSTSYYGTTPGPGPE